MKKFLIVCFALSACTNGGGIRDGSGGGISAGGSDELTPAQRAAIASNKNVTGMLTFLQTDANGNTVFGRGASVRSTAGTYDLSNVHFAIADEGFDDEGFKFVVDGDGKIIGIDMGFSEHDSYPEDGPAYLERGAEDDSIEFTGLVNDGNGNNNGNGGRSNWKPAVYTYNSLGKTEGLGLRYSDFGYVDIDTEGREFWRPAFIAGYDDGKKIAKENITGITSDDTFTGRVVGHVMSVKDGEDNGQALPLEATASLTFNQDGTNGPTSVMNANFENWYAVQYTEDDAGKVVRFSDYTYTADGEGDDDLYRLVSDVEEGGVYASDAASGLMLDNTLTWTDDGEEVSRVNSDVRYFGENGVPTEAVGLIQVRDCGGAECMNNYDETPEVRMDISFGVKQ
ncbi:MAG: hypothetical protein J6Y07_03835 [Alphaproteobacteria bacterium]|nr:hypothetical protein [Alphaproteobacteria bacterium]